MQIRTVSGPCDICPAAFSPGVLFLAAPYSRPVPGCLLPAGPGPPGTRTGDRGLTPEPTHGDAVPGPTLGPMAVQMAPSILSADFARLADEAAAVTGVADWLHVDVMDNHFVPNLTLGLPVVEALLKHAGLPLDCHLMIEEPDRWAPAYAEAGARNVTIHAEAASSPVRTLRMIRSAGAGPAWPSTRRPRSSRTPTCCPRST